MKKPQRRVGGALTQLADHVRRHGRGGDDQLVHLNVVELEQLRRKWGEPGTNPETGLPEFSWLSDAIHHPADVLKGSVNPLTLADSNIAKNSNIAPSRLRSMMAGLDSGAEAGLNALKKNPWKILTGIDPISTALWNEILGRNDASITNAFGSPSATTWEQAQKKDPNIDFTRAHDFAKIGDTVAGIVGGGALASSFGGASAAAPTSDTGLGAAMDGLSTGALPAGADASGVVLGASDATLPEIVINGTREGGALAQAAGNIAGGAGEIGSSMMGNDNPLDPSDNSNGPDETGLKNANPNSKSLLSKAGDYVEDPKNWDKILAGAKAVDSLVGGGGGSSSGSSASTGGNEAIAPLPPWSRTAHFDDPSSYYTYGSRGEQTFYNNNTPGGVPGGSNPQTDLGAIVDTNRPPTGYSGGGRLMEGPGTGRSDDIPARLSAGEYVMDAETVALLGDGNNDEGARRLDELRNKLRKQKGKQLSKGKFSSNAKRPEQYLGGEK